MQPRFLAANMHGIPGGNSANFFRCFFNAVCEDIAETFPVYHPGHHGEAMIAMVKEADFAEDVKKQYLEFLQDTLHKAYLELLEQDITKAFIYSYKEQAETLFQNYLDHAEAYVT